MKILLIYPNEPGDVEFKTVKVASYMEIKALFAPHALAAIAALTPERHDVTIFDEAIHGPAEKHLENNQYDIVGLHLTTNLLKRCLNIGAHVRKNYPHSYLIAGGIGLSSISDDQQKVFQTVFHGEAEESWPEFLEDFENGKPEKIYRKISHPDMSKVPIPKWELIADDLKKYAAVSIQTTRGCPFDCNFCNVIYTYGRKMRCKTVDQVIEEVKLLQKLKVTAVFFADDNFVGNRKFAKEILYRLKELNNSFDVPILFMTQLDITIANDDELLELLADCNFVQLMIGIEAVDPVTLKEMNKLQNLTLDIPKAVRKIQSYGLLVTAHMIVGADTDTMKAFDYTEEFIINNGITEYLLHPLMAPLGTKLWYQLKKDGRLIDYDRINDDFTDIVSNIIPKQISRIDLMRGMIEFWKKLDSVRGTAKRIGYYLNHIDRIPKVSQPSLKGMFTLRKLIYSTLGHFMFKADKEDRQAFFFLFLKTQRKSKVLISRFIYVYTNYLMNRYRAQLYTEILEQQIRIEKTDPTVIVPLDTQTPIPESIFTFSKEIFNATYSILRETLDTKPKLYNAAIETITDFSNVFGKDLTEFDGYQRKNLKQCAARVLNTGEWKKEKYPDNGEPKLPEDKPPAGFFMQMFNSLDSNIRFNSN